MGIKDRYMYMYRNLNGKSVFTGFVKDPATNNVIWIAKDEKQHRVMNFNLEVDRSFFMSHMTQYDK
jgi:hypothetical protein